MLNANKNLKKKKKNCLERLWLNLSNTGAIYGVKIMKEYYFITVFEKLTCNELGWSLFGASRCWGFFSDKNMAIQSLHDNVTNMNEFLYKYAVLEGYHEGISNGTGYQQWFEYNPEKDGFYEIDKPSFLEGFGGWAIG